MTDTEIITLNAEGLTTQSGIVRVYNYHPDTGEFTAATDEYLMAGVGIPANATTIAPLDVTEGKTCAFSDNGWVLLEDHRGEKVYSTTTGLEVAISALGDYPASVTKLAPTTSFDKWDGTQWVTDKAAQQASGVNAAVKTKAALISEANSITQAWQTQLLLGIITDADKATLTRWMTYVQAVQAVDTTVAPAIKWPDKPEVQS